MGGDDAGSGLSEGVEMVDAGTGSFLGGAGSVWSVSGRFVSRREDVGGGEGVDGTTEGFEDSWVDREKGRMAYCGIRFGAGRSEDMNGRRGVCRMQLRTDMVVGFVWVVCDVSSEDLRFPKAHGALDG